MPRKKSDSEKLADLIVKGITDKQAKDVVVLNLQEIDNAIADFFVICHGTSRTQVEAIADSVIETTIKKIKSKPWHREGFENAEWILLDYVDVVVHIFQREVRDFYQLEKLWADAKVTHVKFKE
jgi:ribosome-associated protein